MNHNKKLSLIFIFFVLLPLGLIFLNNYLGESQKSVWSYDHKWIFALYAYGVGIIANIYIAISNYRANFHSKTWYGISSIVTIIFIGLFYITYSFSHFGF